MESMKVWLGLAVLVSLSGCKTATAQQNDVRVRCTHSAEGITRHEPDQTMRELAVHRLVRRCMAEAGYTD